MVGNLSIEEIAKKGEWKRIVDILYLKYGREMKKKRIVLNFFLKREKHQQEHERFQI